MKHWVVLAALCCSLQSPLAAEDLEGPHERSLVGTWIAQLADATGNITLFEVGDFSSDGAYTGANVNGLHSAHKGVWRQIERRKYMLTVLFFTQDPHGSFNGIVKARIYITLAPDRNSYESVAERIVMDTGGNVLSVTSGIAGHAVRMRVEVPESIAPLE